MGLLQAKAMFRPLTQVRAGILLCSLFLPFLAAQPASPAEGASLSGIVSFFRHCGAEGGSAQGYIDEETGKFVQQEAPKLNEQSPKLDESGAYNRNASDDHKPPDWIEGKVFSNSDLYMYSFWYMPPFKKEWRWEIPSNKSSVIHLRPSLTSYWKGYKPDGRCAVTCVPFGEKGRFKFYHDKPDGPHGFLEREGENDKGFPRYRFWFAEDPNQN